MSAVKGVNRTLADTPTPGNRLKPGEYDGRKKVMSDEYEAAALAIGSTITMGPRLPKGAIVTGIKLMADALGATVTLAVGDAEDPNRYILATAMNTANKVVAINAIAGFLYEVDRSDSDNLDDQITITTADAVATGTIKIEVEYVHD